jgi:glycosyltransferase involved in cell wall biosynthesis
MHICHVLETAGGGSGQVVLALAQHGLVCRDDVTVLYAPDRAEAAFVEALHALPGIRILTSPMQRRVGLRDIVDGWRLWRTLRQAGPFDIIHGHSSKAGALTRLVGPFLPGSVFYTPHAFYSMRPGASPLYGLIERVLSWLTPCVICVSMGEYRHGQKLGIVPSKLLLIPNGLTPAFTVTREQARHKMGFDDGRILFGFVGRMESQKNPLHAVAAFAKIVQSHPEAHLVMAGDGSLRAAIETECARLHLQSHIDMLGFCDAREIMPAFDGLVCSSDFETLPISFIECLHAGVPIVTTPIGGAEEAILEGLTGFVAPSFSVNDLAGALAKFLDLSAEQRRNMGENARKHAAHFTTAKMGAEYRKAYTKFKQH